MCVLFLAVDMCVFMGRSTVHVVICPHTYLFGLQVTHYTSMVLVYNGCEIMCDTSIGRERAGHQREKGCVSQICVT